MIELIRLVKPITRKELIKTANLNLWSSNNVYRSKNKMSKYVRIKIGLTKKRFTHLLNFNDYEFGEDLQRLIEEDV